MTYIYILTMMYVNMLKHINLPDSIAETLRFKSEQTGLTQSRIIVTAIKQYLGMKDPEPRRPAWESWPLEESRGVCPGCVSGEHDKHDPPLSGTDDLKRLRKILYCACAECAWKDTETLRVMRSGEPKSPKIENPFLEPQS